MRNSVIDEGYDNFAYVSTSSLNIPPHYHVDAQPYEVSDTNTGVIYEFNYCSKTNADAESTSHGSYSLSLSNILSIPYYFAFPIGIFYFLILKIQKFYVMYSFPQKNRALQPTSMFHVHFRVGVGSFVCVLQVSIPYNNSKFMKLETTKNYK
jgi:hypothetical protein